MDITRLGYCLEDDYPTIDWTRHAPMADIWLEIDERHRAGEPVADLLDRIGYRLRLNRRWPRVDCISMVPGLGVSARARFALEKLGVPGMQFLEFRVNGEPFFLFFTNRRVDCLDRERSQLRYFRAAPPTVKQVVAYAFREDRLRPSDVFTVPELSDKMFFWSQQTFITDAARATIEAMGLVGFRFEALPEASRPAQYATPASRPQTSGNVAAARMTTRYAKNMLHLWTALTSLPALTRLIALGRWMRTGSVA